MAIQTRIVNSSYTEIYVGGGNFITQSAPTNFHQFWTQKVLTPGESIEDFKEVTASEKAAIEASDAKWERPSEEFMAECEATGAVVYNRDTGFFEINGLKDVTTAQMRIIMRESSGPNFLCDNCHSYDASRTFLPIANSRGHYSQSCMYAFQGCAYLEALDFGGSSYVGLQAGAFGGCIRLKRIVNGIVRGVGKTFLPLIALEEIYLVVSIDVTFANSPNLRTDCVAYMVEHAANTAPITLTLHPEAYARITDELFALAAEKNITIAST